VWRVHLEIKEIKMADVTSLAVGATTVGANYKKHVISQSGVGEEVILKIAADAGMLNTELDAAIAYITTAHGTSGAGDSAHTIGGLGTATGAAFVSGTTTVVFLRVQGTGDHDAGWLAAIKAAAEAVTPDTGTTFTCTIEAVFKPAK
jgi:hypothetical protein